MNKAKRYPDDIMVKKVFGEVSTYRNPFSKKIKSLEEIKKIIGERPRKKKVVMCHGTYDVVHPGHIRQLIFAKTKGDILIVDLTADKFVPSKRNINPYVPHELRALNISAFEMVDYVFIDNLVGQPVPSLLYLEPDIYIRGYEYSIKSHPGIQREIDTVLKYGGDMVFSPGDIVFSSSQIITKNNINLSLYQTLNLMNTYKISFNNLRLTIDKFRGKKVCLIGLINNVPQADNLKWFARILESLGATVKLLLTSSKNNNLLALQKKLKKNNQSKHDAIVFYSPFSKQHSKNLTNIIRTIPNNVLKIAIPHKNFELFKNFDFLLLDEKYSRSTLELKKQTAREICRSFLEKSGAKYLILDLNNHGAMATIRQNKLRDYAYLDSFTSNKKQGISNSLFSKAASVLGFISSKNIIQSLIVGNIASALQLSKDAKNILPRALLMRSITILEKQAANT